MINNVFIHSDNIVFLSAVITVNQINPGCVHLALKTVPMMEFLVFFTNK